MVSDQIRSFLYRKSKLINFLFPIGAKRFWDEYYKNSCSPSEADSEGTPAWEALKQQFPWIGRPTAGPVLDGSRYDDRWNPSISSTESPSPGGEGIYNYLDISTIHITPRDRAMLLQMTEDSWLTAIQHDFGTIVLIPEDVSERQVVSNEFSKYFLLVFNYAVNSGARMINFDRDGQRLDDLFSKF